MYGIDPQTLKPLISELEDAAKKYYAGELPRAEYKGTSGRFGSYAQRGDAISMVRLRMTAGRLTKPKMKFIADTMNKYQIETGHFTTCEAIQLHDITSPEVICEIVKTALDFHSVHCCQKSCQTLLAVDYQVIWAFVHLIVFADMTRIFIFCR